MNNILHPQPQQFIRGSADKLTEIRVDADEESGQVHLGDPSAYVIKDDFKLFFVLFTHLYDPCGKKRRAKTGES